MAAVGIFVMGGVIDSDYRGELKIILYNGGLSAFTIAVGDRIGQLEVVKRHTITIKEVTTSEVLNYYYFY